MLADLRSNLFERIYRTKQDWCCRQLRFVCDTQKAHDFVFDENTVLNQQVCKKVAHVNTCLRHTYRVLANNPQACPLQLDS